MIVSVSPWLVWSWIPVGIVGGLVELWVFRLANRWEYGPKAQVGWTVGSWFLVGLMGWVMAFRLLWAPLVLLGAWRERHYRLADEEATRRAARWREGHEGLSHG